MRRKMSMVLVGLVSIGLLAVIYWLLLQSGALPQVAGAPFDIVVADDADEYLVQATDLKRIGDRFFVLDKGDWSIRIYDRDFRHLNRVPLTQGQGPQELPYLGGMAVANDRIWVAGLDRILELDRDGRPIGGRSLPLTLVNEFVIIGDRLYTVNMAWLSNQDRFGDPKHPFLCLNMTTGTVTNFGQSGPSQAARGILPVLAAHNDELVVHFVTEPVLYRHDPKSLDLIARVRIPCPRSGDIVLSHLTGDPYGHGYLFLAQVQSDGSAVFGLVCLDSDLQPIRFQKIPVAPGRIKSLPVRPVVDDRLNVHALVSEGNLVLRTRIVSDLFQLGAADRLVEYLNQAVAESAGDWTVTVRLPDVAGRAEQAGLVGSNLQTRFERAIGVSLMGTVSVIGFDSESAWLAFDELYPRVGLVQEGRLRPLMPVEEADRLGGLYVYQALPSGILLHRGRRGASQPAVELIEFDCQGSPRDVRPLPPEWRPMFRTPSGLLVGTVWNADRVPELHVGPLEAMRPLLTSDDLLHRGIEPSSLGRPLRVSSANNETLVVLLQDRYFLLLDLSGRIAAEGRLTPGAVDHGWEVEDGVIGESGDMLLLQQQVSPEGHGWRMRLTARATRSNSVPEVLLEFDVPFHPRSRLNRHGDLLLWFPDFGQGGMPHLYEIRRQRRVTALP